MASFVDTEVEAAIRRDDVESLRRWLKPILPGWDRVEELLSRGAAVNARGRRSRTLLMYAVRQGDRRRIEWLVQQGADLDAKARQAWERKCVSVT